MTDCFRCKVPCLVVPRVIDIETRLPLAVVGTGDASSSSLSELECNGSAQIKSEMGIATSEISLYFDIIGLPFIFNNRPWFGINILA